MSSDTQLMSEVTNIADECVSRLQKGKKLLFAGNGGSAADCQHMAGEYVSRFLFDRDGLPAIALTTDSSILTAIGNDYGFENLFSRQVEALGASGDLLFCYSTSGNSENILKAIEAAKKMDICVAGMTGFNKGKMDDMCDYLIQIPSSHTPNIQEGHLIAGHAICCAVEQQIFNQ
ncbi:MAG: Phosphoheptose isomerase [SAR116 cluster bacterium]|nr:MAG: Phosphoheptose isomerase [SAR116 cluster bacterium]